MGDTVRVGGVKKKGVEESKEERKKTRPQSKGKKIRE